MQRYDTQLKPPHRLVIIALVIAEYNPLKWNHLASGKQQITQRCHLHVSNHIAIKWGAAFYNIYSSGLLFGLNEYQSKMAIFRNGANVIKHAGNGSLI